MKIAEIYIDNEEYDKALNEYLKLIKKENIEDFYKELITIHALYNLIDHIDLKNINNLINDIDIDTSPFKGHFYEIKYIYSIKILNKDELNKLNNKIQNDLEIILPIKKRVNKINEYLLNTD